MSKLTKSSDSSGSFGASPPSKDSGSGAALSPSITMSSNRSSRASGYAYPVKKSVSSALSPPPVGMGAMSEGYKALASPLSTSSPSISPIRAVASLSMQQRPLGAPISVASLSSSATSPSAVLTTSAVGSMVSSASLNASKSVSFLKAQSDTPFYNTLPVFCDSRRSLWGMEGVHKDKYVYNRMLEENEAAAKRAEEEKAAAAAQKKLEAKLAAEKQAVEKVAPKKIATISPQSRRSLRRQTVTKVVTEEDRAKMREKMKKLEDLVGEDDWAAPLPNPADAPHEREHSEYGVSEQGDDVPRPMSSSSRGGTPDIRPPSENDDRGSTMFDGSEKDQDEDSDEDLKERELARSRRSRARTTRSLRPLSSRGSDANSRLSGAASSPNKPGSPTSISEAQRSLTQRRILSGGTPKSSNSSGGGSDGGLGNTCEPPVGEAVPSRAHGGDAAQESNYTDIPDFHKFFGPEAKIEFRRKYRKIYRDMDKAIQGKPNFTASQSSPRARYIREVIRHGLPPLPLIMRRMHDPRAIDLGKKGLGDEKIMPVIHILDKLPTLNSINLSDNRLTDASLMPLVVKLRDLSHLIHLDLSYNKIDDSSEYLMDYLRDEECTLQILVMNGADVDDIECGNLAEALSVNRSVLSLSLTNNKIGAAEIQNVATPDFTTGGEALGSMLEKNTTLLELDCSWNFIRLESACAVAQSLTVNKSLQVLKLSYNGFGDVPTQELGVALKQNESLEVLDLAYNSITPKASTVLQNALIHNKKIRSLVLDGNVLGNVGAKALVAAVQRATGESRILSISFSNCDCEREEKDLFDAGSPGGEYLLNLAEPYGMMVAEECMYLCNYRAGCELKKLRYSPSNNSFQNIILKRYKANHKSVDAGPYMKKFCSIFLVPSKEHKAIGALTDMLNCFELFPTVKLVKKIFDRLILFYREKEELCQTPFAKTQLFDSFEGELLTSVFRCLFRLADEDMSGYMRLEEFISCLELMGADVDINRARNLFVSFDRNNSGTIDEAEFDVLMMSVFCRPDDARGTLVQSNTNQPWVIPKEGMLQIEVDFQCQQAAIADISNNASVMNLIEAMRNCKTENEKMVLFEQAISSPYYFMSFEQAQLLFNEISKLIDNNLDVISRMLPQLVNAEHCGLFLDSLLDDYGKLSLRVKMGQMYNCLLGLPTGHYNFDFKLKQARNEARALAAIWGSETATMRSQGCNTSQKGNFSNFRNEMLGTTHIEGLDAAWFTKCPTSGRLNLDYVSTSRPRQGIESMRDLKFFNFIEELELHSIRDFILKNDTAGALERVPPCVSLAKAKESILDFYASNHYRVSLYPREIMRDFSRPDYDPNARPDTPDFLKDKPDHDEMVYPPCFLYCFYKLLQLQLELPRIWLSGSQALEIVNMFPPEGYMRVMVFVSIFSRIVEFDDKIPMIVDHVFSLDERNEVMHRLGILNVYDPLYSDRMYKLDLRRWEHREVCRAVLKLAVDQPGDNVLFAEYRWSKYDSPVPGWTLPATWVAQDVENSEDSGPRRTGWVCIEYTSSGLNIPSVRKACLNLRKSFLAGALRPML